MNKLFALALSVLVWVTACGLPEGEDVGGRNHRLSPDDSVEGEWTTGGTANSAQSAAGGDAIASAQQTGGAGTGGGGGYGYGYGTGCGGGSYGSTTSPWAPGEPHPGCGATAVGRGATQGICGCNLTHDTVSCASGEYEVVVECGASGTGGRFCFPRPAGCTGCGCLNDATCGAAGSCDGSGAIPKVYCTR